MGVTSFDQLNAKVGRLKTATTNATTVADYYGEDNEAGITQWQGGELYYNTSDNRIYVQTATSGTTATWKRLVTQFATSTTSTSTSSSTSTSTSTSSSTSTSTSTSSTTTP